jgi:hypothetical protein
MKNYIILIIMTVLMAGAVKTIIGQEVADTLKQPATKVTKPSRDLPPIEMQEYTIVGLAKVSLPRKIRTRIFKEVKIGWSENQEIYRKEPPAITFQFSRIKPSLFRLYEFPWLDSKIYYGSYNTAGVNVNMQFKAANTMPYLSAEFGRSDGHVDNAQWARMGMQAGIHQQLANGHLFSIATDYQFMKRGIWGSPANYQQEWETQSTFWNFSGNLDQEWSDQFHTDLGGNYRLDDFENAFRYKDNGGQAYAKAFLGLNRTGIGLKGEFASTAITVSDRNLALAPVDSTALRDYKSTLLSGLLYLQQQIGGLSLQGGARYQAGEDRNVTETSEKIKTEDVFPYASISLGFSGRSSVYGRFRPGLEIVSLRDEVRELPFSDFGPRRLLNYRARWEAGFNLNIHQTLDVNVLGRFSKVKYYPAILMPTDSLSGAMAINGYPGWVYGVIEEAKLNEITAVINWNFQKAWRVSGWVTYLHSDIRKSGQYPVDILGNSLPYTPDFSAYGKLSWNFLREHQLAVWAKYTGRRYDDLYNSYELDGFFLLNTQLDLKFGQNVIFYIAGENLLDSSYDIWKGFIAPGITGRVGLRLVL